MKNRKSILEDVLQLLRKLADDWEYGGEIAEGTYLLADLGLASLDVVILANAVQERYGQIFPFPDFYAEIGQREPRDVTVGEWADFIFQNLNTETPQGLSTGDGSR
jgi:acyl carrier protein